MKGLKRFGVEILPLLIGFILQVFIHGEIEFTILLILVIIATFAIRYNKGEWKLFLIGLVMGILFEIVAGLYHRMQFWGEASLFGVPYWLPILWALGFVLIYRIGKFVLE